MGEVGLMEDNFKCPKCGATFKSKDELMKHKKEKHPM